MIPTLHTKRLLLDGFRPEDAPLVQRYAGEWAVARFTKNIPHPYPDGVAEEWVAKHASQAEAGTHLVFAIRMAADQALMGGIALTFESGGAKAVLGYWLGQAFWNHGYATEAVRAVIEHGFSRDGLKTIRAHHALSNLASGRVLEKAGMRRTGGRATAYRGTELIDVVDYGIDRDSF